jgi:hypothetical protein
MNIHSKRLCDDEVAHVLVVLDLELLLVGKMEETHEHDGDGEILCCLLWKLMRNIWQARKGSEERQTERDRDRGRKP